MNLIDFSYLKKIYPKAKEINLNGRWITLSDIEPLIEKLKSTLNTTKLGRSEEKRTIYKLMFGTGDKKILIWSQMHGNESTGTKAVFDFLNFISKNISNNITQTIINNCTLIIVPILNPDGAQVYTRVNANNVDLNRDAVDKKAKESKLLRSLLDEFQPHFCFNLHDQRTIFGVENTQNPAAISFLAPSEEETRAITKGRKHTMNVIVAMNSILQKIIPNHIGRYTDEFYPTATGDNFQKLGYNTILIEAGHYPNDYKREKVREYNFYALLQGIYHIASENDFSNYKDYFTIPNNQTNFFDVIHRDLNNKKDTAYQYVESIKDGTFVLSLEKKEEGNLSKYLAHKEIFIEN
ncbi:MAG: M14 family zinc carboxypeptidase [Flavobacteriaceae bacterium]